MAPKICKSHQRGAYLLVPTDARARTTAGVSRLQFKDGPEEVLRGLGQEVYLCVGVQSVEDGALGGQDLVDVRVVALVVVVRGHREPGSQVHVTLHLWREGREIYKGFIWSLYSVGAEDKAPSVSSGTDQLGSFTIIAY